MSQQLVDCDLKNCRTLNNKWENLCCNIKKTPMCLLVIVETTAAQQKNLCPVAH